MVEKKKTSIPKALNICIPPYFPSNRTVLLSGLKARHILTKTTSKQPIRHKKEQKVPHITSKHQNIGHFKKIFRKTSVIRNIIRDRHSLKASMSLNERKNISVCIEYGTGNIWSRLTTFSSR